MTRNDKSQLTPQQEEIIRLCRLPMLGQKVMRLLWVQAAPLDELMFQASGAALCQLGHNPTNVSKEGGCEGHLEG